MAVVDQLNRRWRNARPSSSLAEAGVMVHLVDGIEEDGAAFWRPRQASHAWDRPETLDRVSASMIYRASPAQTRISLFAGAHGYGLVFRPYDGLTCLLCSYAGDGGSASKTCHPPGPSATCVPGCARAPADPKHDPARDEWCVPPPGSLFCANDPTRPLGPARLDVMLRQHRARPNTYNELVLDPQCARRAWPLARPSLCPLRPRARPGLSTLEAAATERRLEAGASALSRGHLLSRRGARPGPRSAQRYSKEVPPLR
jgi:hypothetical protein